MVSHIRFFVGKRVVLIRRGSLHDGFEATYHFPMDNFGGVQIGSPVVLPSGKKTTIVTQLGSDPKEESVVIFAETKNGAVYSIVQQF